MIVDLLFLAVLLISGIIALFRGLIREVLSILGLVGGVAAAYFGGPMLSPVMGGWLGVPGTLPEGQDMPKLFDILPYDIVANALSYGAVFIVVVIMLSVLSHFIAEGAKSIGLGPIDRTLGFIFGLVRGLLLLGILYLPVHFFIDQDTKDSWFKDSKSHFYLEKISGKLAQYIPSTAVEDAQENIDAVQEVDQTRKKLEDINLLKRKDESVPLKNTAEPSQNTQGYDQEFRGQMNDLIEQKNAAPPPSDSLKKPNYNE